MLKKIVFLIVLSLSAFTIQAQSSDSYRSEYNPFLAGTLSWYSAGLGQIYTKNYMKGTIFFTIDTTLLLLTLNSIADFNLNVDEKFGVNMNVQLKSRKDIEYNSLTASFFMISYFTFHFYNVFDAVLSAYKKNIDLSFDYNPSDQKAALVLNTRFN